MSEIKLTTKDADLILSYIREQLEEENNEWKEYLEDREKIVQHYKDNPLFKIMLSDEDVARCYKETENEHNKHLNKLIKIIELLTVGSEQ